MSLKNIAFYSTVQYVSEKILSVSIALSLYQNVKSFCKKCVCGIAEECCGEPTVFIPSFSCLLLSLKWDILVIGSDRSPKFLCSAIKLEPPQGRTQDFQNRGASPGHSWPHLATTFQHRGLTWPQLAPREDSRLSK